MTAATTIAGGAGGPMLLTRREAAALAGMSAARFDRLRAGGLAPGPAVEQGDGRGKQRFVRWSAAEVRAWIEQGLPPMSRFSFRPRKGGAA